MVLNKSLILDTSTFGSVKNSSLGSHSTKVPVIPPTPNERELNSPSLKYTSSQALSLIVLTLNQ